MARPKKRNGGRVTPKQTRPSGPPPRLDAPVDKPDDDAHPLANVIAALEADHPGVLLDACSPMAFFCDPSTPQPVMDDDEVLDTDALINAFVSIDDAVTTALLGALSVLSGDDAFGSMCASVVADRDWVMPPWFQDLGAATVSRTCETVDELRDGENIYVELTWPGGKGATVVVYVDHNMGTVVKDSFVVPDRIAALSEFAEQVGEVIDIRFSDIDPADARARIEDAVRTWTQVVPTIESETWPMVQPFVRWATEMLPQGGRGYGTIDWAIEDLDLVKAEFLASVEGASVAADDVDLVDHVLAYGSGYGNQDPKRWSPVRVELFLVDWVPRTVVAPYDDLVNLPEVLSWFVRWAHEDVGISDARTDETLDAIEAWQPDYFELIGD
jgi:hypothetical protein